MSDLSERHRTRLGATRRARPGRVDARARATPSRSASRVSTPARCASRRSASGAWIVNQWLKKAVLLSFRINDNRVDRRRLHDASSTRCRRSTRSYDAEQFRARGTRVVPDAVVRRGAYVAPDVVLMPSFVNIGAYVDQGSMIDTWATVGSCAQIGKNVHLSGGAGIGGVLEPLQAAPTIIEDNCFIGARSEVVEGVDRRARQRARHGRLHRPEHEDLRPRDGRDALRPRAGGLGRRLGQLAVEGRQVQPVLRRHRQEGRREDAREDVSTSCCVPTKPRASVPTGSSCDRGCQRRRVMPAAETARSRTLRLGAAIPGRRQSQRQA